MVEESNYATHVRQKDDKHLIRHFSAVLLLVAGYKHYLTINVIVITDLVRFHKPKPKPKPSKLECCSSSRMYCTCVHGTRYTAADTAQRWVDGSPFQRTWICTDGSGYVRRTGRA